MFETRSGELIAERSGKLLAMNFHAHFPQPCSTPIALIEGLGKRPVEVLAADDYIAVFDSESTVRALSPDFAKLRNLNLRGVCVTSQGSDVDFVSRFFAPKFGIQEDPVTGSAHCELAPYWSTRLGKINLSARQASKRGGDILCRMNGNRIILSGRAVTFMEAEIDTGTWHGVPSASRHQVLDPQCKHE